MIVARSSDAQVGSVATLRANLLSRFLFNLTKQVDPHQFVQKLSSNEKGPELRFRRSGTSADMGDDHSHASEAREDVVTGLHAALTGTASQVVTDDEPFPPGRPHLRLIDPIPDV